MSDIAALIEPRPQFIESGRNDHAYPLEPAISMVSTTYELLGAASELGLDSLNGAYWFRVMLSIPRVVEQLTGRGADYVDSAQEAALTVAEMLANEVVDVYLETATCGVTAPHLPPKDRRTRPPISPTARIWLNTTAARAVFS